MQALRVRAFWPLSFAFALAPLCALADEPAGMVPVASPLLSASADDPSPPGSATSASSFAPTVPSERAEPADLPPAEPSPRRAPRVRPKRRVTLTWEPFTLVEPLGALAVEARITEDLSAQLMVAAGTTKISRDPNTDTHDRMALLLLQARGRYYFTGGFDTGGLALQAEMTYPFFFGSGSAYLSTSGGFVPPGLALAAMLASKLVLPIGFTIDGGVGLQGNVVGGRVPHAAFLGDISPIQLAARLGIGWTF